MYPPEGRERRERGREGKKKGGQEGGKEVCTLIFLLLFYTSAGLPSGRRIFCERGRGSHKRKLIFGGYLL
jgi:hypothetical protein